MSDRLTWHFELMDRMSGPAKRIDRALGGVDRALHSVDRAAESTGAGFSGTARAIMGAGAAVGRFVARAATVVATTAAVTGLAAAAYSANEAIEAMTSRDQNLRALQIISGSAEEALRMRGRFSDLSEFLGIDPRETANGMQELLTKGFDEIDATRIFQGTADIAAISPSADVGRITLAMSQIRQAGVLQGDELNQLAESGLPLVHVYERIGAAMGVAASEVRNLRGTVPAAVAIQAILDGIQDTTGQQLGAVARAASLSLGGQLERLKQAPTRLFEALADSANPLGQRLAGMVARLNEFLNPNSAAGQRVIGMMLDGFNTVVSALEKIPAVMATINGWFQTARGWMDALPAGMLDNLVLGLKTMAVVAGAVVLGIGGIVAAAVMAQGYIISRIGAAVRPFVELYEGVKRVLDYLTLLYVSFQRTGGSAIQGFIGGFMAQATAALTMVQTFGDQVANALRSALGIHSPSRVFMEMGAMSGEGFALGLSGSMPDASYDYGGVAPPTTAAAASTAAGARSFSVTIDKVEIVANDRDGGERAAEGFYSRVTELFEALAIEQGMA
jgi:tape measure domain-containing protein